MSSAPAFRNLRLDHEPGGIVVATLDMPGRPFNVFSDDMIDELAALIDHVAATPGLRGLVLASSKDAFMAGADLAMVQGFTRLRFAHGAAEIRRIFSRLTYLLRRLERLPVTTVAAVNGLALGGGLELAMACHYRIAARGSAPVLGLPEVLLGLLPGAGGTQRLPRLTTPEFAARVLLGGQPVTPDAALEAGLVDALAEGAALRASAVEMARHALPGARWDQPGWHAPADSSGLVDAGDGAERLTALAWTGAEVAHLYPAVSAIVRCLREGYPRDIDGGIETEIDCFLPLMLDPTAGNMIGTSFLAKTAAARRAAARLGRARDVARVAVRGGDAPARLARRCEIVSVDAADAQVVVAGPRPADAPPDTTLRLRGPDDDASADCGAELRLHGPLAGAECVEVTEGGAAASALGLALRLRLVPVATDASTPGPGARLLAVVREFCERRAASSAARAALAHALDLGGLLRSAGLAVGPLGGYTDADRATGLALMTEVAAEAAACLAEGALAHAEDADVLAVVGLGFPAWSGGPLRYLDMLARGELPGAVVPAGLTGAPFYTD
ncbi:MAG: enoyl-CoA hydratase-related protein [Gammaproteobacteria bacterium]